jgi:hypothetical protein
LATFVVNPSRKVNDTNVWDRLLFHLCKIGGCEGEGGKLSEQALAIIALLFEAAVETGIYETCSSNAEHIREWLSGLIEQVLKCDTR